MSLAALLPFRLLISLFPVIGFEIPITRAFFDFPRGLKLSGVDCTWLNRRAGKMKRALFFPLATRAGKTGSSYPLGISRGGPARTSCLFGHIINPLMTKLGRFFGVVIDHAFVLVNNKAKKNLANQNPAILNSRLVNNAHIY